jgi:hypothetical protein
VTFRSITGVTCNISSPACFHHNFGYLETGECGRGYTKTYNCSRSLGGAIHDVAVEIYGDCHFNVMRFGAISQNWVDHQHG